MPSGLTTLSKTTDEAPLRSAHWCTWCHRWCPGQDADGYCGLADRAELDRRAHWLRTGELLPVVTLAPCEALVAAEEADAGETASSPVVTSKGRRRRAAPVQQMALTWE